MNEFNPDWVEPTVVIAASAYAELLNERDRYMAEASERMQTIGRLEGERDRIASNARIAAETHATQREEYRQIVAERDALAAQVAALVEALTDTTGRWSDLAGIGMTDSVARANELIANIPAAAAVYQAAQAYCEEVQRRQERKAQSINGYMPDKAEQHRLFDDWRKAAGR